MAEYVITDKVSGRKFKITGEVPPSKEKIQDLLTKARAASTEPAAPEMAPQGPSFEDSANVYAEQDMSAAIPNIPKSPEDIAKEKRQAEFRAQPKLNQFAQGAKAFATGTLHGIQKLGRVLPMSDLTLPEKNPNYEEEVKKDPKSASYYVRKDDRKEFNAKKDKEIERYLQDYALASEGLGVEDIPYYGLDMLATAIPGFKGAKYAAKFKYTKPIQKAAAEGAAWTAPALTVHQAQAVAETGKPDYISGAVDLATGIPLSTLATGGGKMLQKSGVKDLYKKLGRVPDLESANPLTKKNVEQALEADMIPAFGSAENVSEVATGNLREAESVVRAERADVAKQASFKPEKRVDMGGGIGAIRILPDNSQIVNARDLSPEELDFSLQNLRRYIAEPSRKSRSSDNDANMILTDMLESYKEPGRASTSNFQFLRNPEGQITGGIQYSVTNKGVAVDMLASLDKGKGKELLGHVERLAKNRNLPIYLDPLSKATDFYKRQGYALRYPKKTPKIPYDRFEERVMDDAVTAYDKQEDLDEVLEGAIRKYNNESLPDDASEAFSYGYDLGESVIDRISDLKMSRQGYRPEKRTLIKKDPSKIIKTSPTLMSGKMYTAEDIGLGNKDLYHGTIHPWKKGEKIDLSKTDSQVFFAGDNPRITDNYSMSNEDDMEAILDATSDTYPYRPNTRPYKLNPKAKVQVIDFTSNLDTNFPTSSDLVRYLEKYPEADVLLIKNAKDVGESLGDVVQDQYVLTPKGKKTGAFIEKYTREMGSSLGVPIPKVPKAPEQKNISNFAPKPKLTSEPRRAVPAQAAITKVEKSLETERLDPTLNKSVESDYDDAAEALDYWKAEAAKRTTAKGPHKHMTVEDALSFRQAIDKQVRFRRKSKDASKALTPGFERVSAMLRAEMEALIKQAAPEVSKQTKKLADLAPVREAFQKVALQEGVRKPSPWTTADVFSFGSTKALRAIQNNPAYGAAKYKIGRGMQGQAPQTLAAFSRTSTSQYNNKKKKGSK